MRRALRLLLLFSAGCMCLPENEFRYWYPDSCNEYVPGVLNGFHPGHVLGPFGNTLGSAVRIQSYSVPVSSLAGSVRPRGSGGDLSARRGVFLRCNPLPAMVR